MDPPLAYHITFTAYGTWLHGDPRGWVEKKTSCILPPDSERWKQARVRMKETPVNFDEAQRELIHSTIVRHCKIRGWTLHACNARTNHVHALVTAPSIGPEDVMDQWKAKCSGALSDAAGLKFGGRARKAGRRKWFTEHGSTKWVNDQVYFDNAFEYVLHQ